MERPYLSCFDLPDDRVGAGKDVEVVLLAVSEFIIADALLEIEATADEIRPVVCRVVVGDVWLTALDRRVVEALVVKLREIVPEAGMEVDPPPPPRLFH